MVRRILVSVLLVVVAASLFAACGSDDEEGSGAGAPADALVISETEFALEPATLTVGEAGTITISAVNDGTVVHALEVEGKDFEEETEEIQAGESAEVTVELAAGTYELYCPIGNHRERGMKGTLTVGEAPSGATTETDESGSDGGAGYGS